MEKTQILFGKTIEGEGLGLGLGLVFGLFYSILDLSLLTRDVTCFRLYSAGKIMRRKCHMKNLTVCFKAMSFGDKQ